MNREDIERIAKEVCALYGSVRPWNSEPDMARVARHFAGYVPDRVVSAVEHWQAEHPEKAPKPSEILDLLRQAHRPPDGLRSPDRCDHPQPWGIVDERVEGIEPIHPLTKDHPIGTRVAICVWCHTEMIRPPDRLLTETEIEERRQRRLEHA